MRPDGATYEEIAEKLGYSASASIHLAGPVGVPDVWNGFRGSLPTAVAVLTRWRHLAQLAASRRSTFDRSGCPAHTRRAGRARSVETIPSAAAAWTQCWDGHLDLDALAFDVSEQLADMADASARTLPDGSTWLPAIDITPASSTTPSRGV